MGPHPDHPNMLKQPWVLSSIRGAQGGDTSVSGSIDFILDESLTMASQCLFFSLINLYEFLNYF
jgi:hypothetical protein